MDLRKIKKLIELLENSQLSEMEITMGDEEICLRRHASVSAAMAPAALPMTATDMVASMHANREVQPVQTQGGDIEISEPEPDGEPVTSPIVGTYYSAPAPDAKLFIRVGQRVAKDDVLCIVEAMKMMNEIKAPHAGTVVSIEVQNAQPVEYGQVLLYLEP
ncbi:MAG: acetyl-CoA carboxylase biotin carboxyl carrier protein [Gammaproteobacteria bacterium]